MRVLLLATLSCLAAAQTPVILDTDIGTDIDDAFALALVLYSAEIDLRGVTTVSADAYGRALIACQFLEAAGRADIPVAAGRSPRPKPHRRGQYRYGQSGSFTKRPVAELAPEFLYRKLQAEPGMLTLITIGDLTNVASLLTAHPEAKAWIARIVIMGGAVRVGYNGKPPVAWEWNIHADIPAAQVVFSSGVPLTVAPLDATMVNLEVRERRFIFSAGAVGAELEKLYKLWAKSTPTLFDPVAVTLAFHPDFFTIEDLRLEVDRKGFTREVPGLPNARVASAVDRAAFLQWYVRRMGDHSNRTPARR